MRLLLALGSLGVGLSIGAPLLAQESLDMTITNAGKIAIDVPIEVAVRGERWEVARTDGAGRATIDFDLVNLGKGAEVEIHQIDCDGDVKVLMVPVGDSYIADRFDEDEPGCRRRRLGLVYWWQSEQVVIALGERAVTDRGDTGFEREVGFKLDMAFWHQFEENVCDRDRIASCEADEVTILPVGFGEIWLRHSLGLGVRGLFGSLEARQAFDDPLLPTISRIEMSVAGLGPYATSRLAISRLVSLHLRFGALYLWNDVEISSRFGDEVVTETRKEHGVRVDLGTAVSVRAGERIRIRLNLDHATGGEEDADRHTSLGAGASVVW